MVLLNTFKIIRSVERMPVFYLILKLLELFPVWRTKRFRFHERATKRTRIDI